MLGVKAEGGRSVVRLRSVDRRRACGDVSVGGADAWAKRATQVGLT
jgi:hypothetical protein